jgi:hypothetical protein
MLGITTALLRRGVSDDEKKSLDVWGDVASVDKNRNKELLMDYNVLSVRMHIQKAKDNAIAGSDRSNLERLKREGRGL